MPYPDTEPPKLTTFLGTPFARTVRSRRVWECVWCRRPIRYGEKAYRPLRENITVKRNMRVCTACMVKDGVTVKGS